MTLLNTWITFNKFNKNILTAVCFLSSSRPICRCVNGAGLPSKEKKCDCKFKTILTYWLYKHLIIKNLVKSIKTPYLGKRNLEDL